MSDLIARQAAIDLWEKYHPTIAVDAMQYDAELRQLPPANCSEFPNNSDTISRQAAIDGKISIQRANGVEIYTDEAVPVEYLKNVPAADVVPYSIEPDGTMTITVPKGTKRIGRILIEEDGTQYGGLFYPDTGGCFLSSMERSEQDG